MSVNTTDAIGWVRTAAPRRESPQQERDESQTGPIARTPCAWIRRRVIDGGWDRSPAWSRSAARPERPPPDSLSRCAAVRTPRAPSAAPLPARAHGAPARADRTRPRREGSKKSPSGGGAARSRVTRRDQGSAEPDERLLEIGIGFDRLLERRGWPCRAGRPCAASRRFRTRIGVARIDLQFLLELAQRLGLAAGFALRLTGRASSTRPRRK